MGAKASVSTAIYPLALDGLKIVYLHWTENFIKRGLVKINHS
jgi:hypothetical protein